MKWAIPRLTIRRLMLVVAGLAVLCGAAAWMIRMTEKSNRYDRRAARHAQEFFLNREYVNTYPVLVEGLRKGARPPRPPRRSSARSGRCRAGATTTRP